MKHTEPLASDPQQDDTIYLCSHCGSPRLGWDADANGQLICTGESVDCLECGALDIHPSAMHIDQRQEEYCRKDCHGSTYTLRYNPTKADRKEASEQPQGIDHQPNTKGRFGAYMHLHGDGIQCLAIFQTAEEAAEWLGTD